MKFDLSRIFTANAEALEAVLADIKTKKWDEIICLGNIVGYGANPNECIELVKKFLFARPFGNHDAAAVGLLSTQHSTSTPKCH